MTKPAASEKKSQGNRLPRQPGRQTSTTPQTYWTPSDFPSKTALHISPSKTEPLDITTRPVKVKVSVRSGGDSNLSPKE